MAESEDTGPGDESPSTLRILKEDGTTLVETPATPSMLRLLDRAVHVNRWMEWESDLTFSSLLLAVVLFDDGDDDPFSQWLKKNFAREFRISMEAIAKTKGFDLSDILREPDRLLSFIAPEKMEQVLRTSASSLLGEAQALLNIVANPSPLDVRHLFAAFIYRPGDQAGDLKRLGFNRPTWSNAFLNQMALLYPAELPGWKDLHRKTFPSEPILIESEGPSTHIATDIWTRNDTLGYRAYAHALYRFMTHPQTRPPLTISIQAPWGGGKTSLMRMLQQELDPGAFDKEKDEAHEPRGAFSVRDALGEIDEWIRTRTQKPLPPLSTLPAPDSGPHRLTIWFNAWKYESTNQVWAGMVDAIIQQVAARLPLHEREAFWLRLNLKRVDADRIRQKVHDRIFRYFWRGIGGTALAVGGALLTSIATAVTGALTHVGPAQVTGWAGLVLTLLVGTAKALGKFHEAREKVEKEPAAVSLQEYLEIPSYSAELGFVHRAEVDLRRVLDCVPAAYKPLVIFIDDLDRCSPAKVAQVVEAVNLFLAGDFPDCMFVLGMDTEMVAAALQAAHKDMIANLPSDIGIPVGWRFMDKFVQLPFLIPVCEQEDVTRFTQALFKEEEAPAPQPEVDTRAREAAQRLTTHSAIEEEARRARETYQLDERQAARFRDQLEAQFVRRKLDEGIKSFNDQSQEILLLLDTATPYFQGNPRELKRFINAFRFHYFLWYAHRARGFEGPSLGQLVRWTMLTMKWPEVVRWLRRGSQPRRVDASNAAPLPASRLRQLEDLGAKAADLTTWQQQARQELQLDAGTTGWLRDEALFRFFRTEGASPEAQRLSGGVGKGLW
ncbi:KAP family P-loop NTPase fold protein [Archangium lansingense]|uniref:P-loop NTPase fold protein n=1 Tax=Archangium lansingense TaxID=2995310 RepID=A0ABT4AAD4_9BACT|nr:P-loop NTPase fold protein [Archangium lansinium]MCY1078632.1 P-loop NTPase fold protein [Archangium lansinium]